MPTLQESMSGREIGQKKKIKGAQFDSMRTDTKNFSTVKTTNGCGFKFFRSSSRDLTQKKNKEDLNYIIKIVNDQR